MNNSLFAVLLSVNKLGLFSIQHLRKIILFLQQRGEKDDNLMA